MMWGGSGWWLFGAVMVIVCVVMMARMMGGHSGNGGGTHRGSDEPERTLANRLASGEIDIDEYERRLQALRHTDDPAHHG